MLMPWRGLNPHSYLHVPSFLINLLLLFDKIFIIFSIIALDLFLVNNLYF